MGTNLKDKILENAKTQIREKRKRDQPLFAQKYNKTKEFKFPAKDKINMEKHFYFPKFHLNPDSTDGWSFGRVTPGAALAVYPVMCSYADFVDNKSFQISQANIAKLAGVSPPTAAKAIDHLVSIEYSFTTNKSRTALLERKMVSEGPRHFYIYNAGFIRKGLMKAWKGQFFIFHTCIITSGVWAELLPRAKVLYLAMRSVARFDPDLYSLIEHIDLDGFELSDFYMTDQYRDRKWDVCERSVAELCREMNISHTNRKPVLEQLEYYQLVEKAGPVYPRFRIQAEKIS